MNLRSKVIRLAHAKPDLRPVLLPLVIQGATKRAALSDRAQELLDSILDEMRPSKNLNEAIFEAAVYTASGALLDDLYLHEGRYIKDEDYVNNPNIRWERVLESLEEVLGGRRKYLLLLQEGWPGTSGRLIKTRKVPGDPNIKDLIAEFVQVTGGDPKSLDQLNAEIYYRLEGFDWRFSGSFRRIAEVYDQIRQWDWYNTDSYFHTHRRPSLRGKWAGVLQDYARHARNALKEHGRERYVDDDYRRTMQEFIDMERDALPNAKKTRGGQKALEDIREEKAKSDRVFARH